MLKLFVMMSLGVFAVTANATGNDAYYTIGSVEVVKVKEEANTEFSFIRDSANCSESGLETKFDSRTSAFSPSDLIEIVNIGKQVWQVMEANKPVVTLEMPVAHAVPSNVKCWAELDQWQNPKSTTYRVSYKNLYGMTVIDFSFRVAYVYGGTFNGTGQYLANVSMIPAHLDVSWGYNFDAKSVVGKLVNVGTKENPTAGMSISLHWQIKTVMKDSQSTVNFFIRGDGEIQKLD